MNYAKANKMVLKQMLKEYYNNAHMRYDWMGYLITEENYPSYHHIEKRESLLRRGESTIATVSNGAYLGKKSHELLHQIEQYDHELYDCWNDLFLIINRMNCYPVNHLWELIFQMKSYTEEVISANKAKKH